MKKQSVSVPSGTMNQPTSSTSAMKARQSAKIAELRKILEQAGYRSVSEQAVVLGLSRSTTWALSKANHKASGVSGSIIKRMLRSADLPPAVRQWIDEYVREKLAGKYGHRRNRLRIFKTQVELGDGAVPSLQREPPDHANGMLTSSDLAIF
jgi:hypothetical protein